MTGLRPSPRGRLFHLFFAAFYQAEQAEAYTAKRRQDVRVVTRCPGVIDTG
jgi:hypothetical protein